MTSASVRDRHEFVCDTCQKVKVVFVDDFAEAWGSLKEEGWETFKHEQHWHHTCPTCVD